MIQTIISIAILLQIGSIRSQCLNNSFFLDNYQPIVDETKINIFIKISTNTSDEDVIKCLEKIVITAQTDLSKKQYNFSIDINSTNSYKNYVLDKLEPLSLYNITLGYKIKNNDKIFDGPVIESFSCFGSPGEPQDLSASSGKDKLDLSWKRPSTVNAPDICYYLVEKRFLNQSKGTEYKVNETSFSITGDDLKRDFEVRVSTYNDYKCYKERFPAAEKCQKIGQNKTSSNYVKYSGNTLDLIITDCQDQIIGVELKPILDLTKSGHYILTGQKALKEEEKQAFDNRKFAFKKGRLERMINELYEFDWHNYLGDKSVDTMYENFLMKYENFVGLHKNFHYLL
ncbi:hypothetical protein BpHYR1_032713 [Brachionus plicatilis]|uniref:Fibronectin type-III domain-containing protein n=1 Tax=Brachionus plicatilis TaxID=10195 RepID=A0A3M7QDS7_BRAPC|nr:hypothetical protein BpHYR1_032713 [Brachionus plicatilis]